MQCIFETLQAKSRQCYLYLIYKLTYLRDMSIKEAKNNLLAILVFTLEGTISAPCKINISFRSYDKWRLRPLSQPDRLPGT